MKDFKSFIAAKRTPVTLALSALGFLLIALSFGTRAVYTRLVGPGEAADGIATTVDPILFTLGGICLVGAFLVFKTKDTKMKTSEGDADRQRPTPLDRLPEEVQRDKTASTPLHIAACKNDVVQVERLIEHGAPVDVADNYGTTPLLRAAQCGSLEVASLLIKKGANIFAADERGKGALHYAAQHNQSEIVPFLINSGIVPNSRDNYDSTPLHRAAEYGFPYMVVVLVDNGADVNSIDRDGQTPLHWAAEEKNNTSVVEMLIRKGANINMRDKEGKTPLSLAKDQEMADFIRKHGGKK